MKKTLSILLATAVLCTFGLALFGCNRNDNAETRRPTATRPSIVGTWEADVCCCAYFLFEFRASGEFILSTAWENNVEVWQEKRWQIIDGKLSIYEDNAIFEIDHNLFGNTLYVGNPSYTRVGSGRGIIGTWEGEWYWGIAQWEFRVDGIAINTVLSLEDRNITWRSIYFWEIYNETLRYTFMTQFPFNVNNYELVISEPRVFCEDSDREMRRIFNNLPFPIILNRR